ncbi:PAS domain S-box protein [Methanocalculus taiwanensis]|uniref:PAS domain S-box protein n=1 Tax=Methanocalculus taiwanensis TaxID=106207 RepID=A0ABD4TMK8_9EURY|nr:ATP-binding protein [Methanocalculus taiwanensis]MCQ1539228.1 PAS domain S-box protein [Methanocalculus taiwanensis]
MQTAGFRYPDPVKCIGTLQNFFTPEERISSIILEQGSDREDLEASPECSIPADASGRDPEYFFFEEIFESSPECILILEGETITRANAASGEFFGIAPDKLAGKTPADLSPAMQPDGESSCVRMERLLLKRIRGPVKFGWIHIAAGGIERKTEVILTPVRVGRHSRIMANIRDITPLIDARQKVQSQYRLLQMTNTMIMAMHTEEKIEDALAVVADELNTLFENSLITIYITSPDSEEAHLAVSRGELPGHRESQGHNRLPTTQEPYATVYQRGDPIFCEIHNSRVSGIIGKNEIYNPDIPTAVGIIPLISDGTIHGSINIFTQGREGFDADEQSLLVNIGREIGGAIRSGMMRDELKATNDLAHLFLDILVHDVNNAHMIIGGSLELLKDAEGEEKESCVNLIRSTLDTAAEIHQNVMMIRSIREGGEKSQRPVPLDAVIQRAIPPGINVHFEPSGAVVYADELLSGIFYNLFSNAVKYGCADAGIWISIRDDMDEVTVTIEDNGPGISDTDKEQLFSRNLRIGSKKKGLGIGLYICMTLARRYGGSIRVTDRVAGCQEEGSAFILTLRSARDATLK